LSYEFCIPAEEHFVFTILIINPEIKIYTESPGRIGCTQVEYLCMGDTYKKPYQKFLMILLIYLLLSALYRVFLNKERSKLEMGEM